MVVVVPRPTSRPTWAWLSPASVRSCGVWSFDTPEATFIDLATLLGHRDRLACRRIILTHLGPSMLEHLPEVPLEVATDGLIIQL